MGDMLVRNSFLLHPAPGLSFLLRCRLWLRHSNWFNNKFSLFVIQIIFYGYSVAKKQFEQAFKDILTFPAALSSVLPIALFLAITKGQMVKARL